MVRAHPWCLHVELSPAVIGSEFVPPHRGQWSPKFAFMAQVRMNVQSVKVSAHSRKKRARSLAAFIAALPPAFGMLPRAWSQDLYSQGLTSGTPYPAPDPAGSGPWGVPPAVSSTPLLVAGLTTGSLYPRRGDRRPSGCMAAPHPSLWFWLGRKMLHGCGLQTRRWAPG
jgi:hypothetical protein